MAIKTCHNLQLRLQLQLHCLRSYSKSVYFDGHHSRALIRMCCKSHSMHTHTQSVALSSNPIQDQVHVQVRVGLLISLKSKSKSCKRLTTLQNMSQRSASTTIGSANHGAGNRARERGMRTREWEWK